MKKRVRRKSGPSPGTTRTRKRRAYVQDSGIDTFVPLIIVDDEEPMILVPHTGSGSGSGSGEEDDDQRGE